MIKNFEVDRIGVSSKWPKRHNVVRAIDRMTPWSVDKIVAYNARLDVRNKVNAPPSSYNPVGYRLNAKAIGLALRGERWEKSMADALGYQLLDSKLDYFWHNQFCKIFSIDARPLRMMNWSVMIEIMAMAISLGWIQEGVLQGFIVCSALRREFQLELSYRRESRRGQFFMLRLFAAWQGVLLNDLPSHAYDEPIYEELLARWDSDDVSSLSPWLLAACDRHTYEAQPDTEENFYDFSRIPCVPLEIMMLFRIRELKGLSNPKLDHPLMAPPFDCLPSSAPAYIPDDLVAGTISRVAQDWPEFWQIVSLATLKEAAVR